MFQSHLCVKVRTVLHARLKRLSHLFRGRFGGRLLYGNVSVERSLGVGGRRRWLYLPNDVLVEIAVVGAISALPLVAIVPQLGRRRILLLVRGS